MEREKIKEEYDELMKLIAYLLELLGNEGMRYDVIKKELTEIKEKFGDARKSEITYLDDEVSIKDLIKEEDVVITISHLGYINVTSANEYRAQKRGGRGVIGGKDKGRGLYRALVRGIHPPYHAVLHGKGGVASGSTYTRSRMRKDQ